MGNKSLHILVLCFVLCCSSVALGQDEPETVELSNTSNTMTNYDFGMTNSYSKPDKIESSTNNKVDEPTTANKTQLTINGKSTSTVASEAMNQAPRSRVEMIVQQDASGNWILTSKQLPGIPNNLEEFSSLRVSTGKAELDQLIQEAGQKYGVDPRLILEVMRQESGFKQYATSPVGAKGLMQFMPATARRFGITDIYDPRQSIEGGAKYLRQLLDMFDGNVELALAGYNAGEHRVLRNGNQVPKIRETQHYVRTITMRYGSTKHTKQTTLAKSTPRQITPMRVEQKDGVVFLTNN